jgi:hypothetical protein
MGELGMIMVAVDEYLRLTERDDMLSALEAHGVDNWIGYEEAVSTYNEENDK